MKLFGIVVSVFLKFLPGEVFTGRTEVCRDYVEIYGTGGTVFLALAAACISENDTSPIGVAFFLFATSDPVMLVVFIFGIVTFVETFDTGV